MPLFKEYMPRGFPSLNAIIRNLKVLQKQPGPWKIFVLALLVRFGFLFFKYVRIERERVCVCFRIYLTSNTKFVHFKFSIMMASLDLSTSHLEEEGPSTEKSCPDQTDFWGIFLVANWCKWGLLWALLPLGLDFTKGARLSVALPPWFLSVLASRFLSCATGLTSLGDICNLQAELSPLCPQVAALVIYHSNGKPTRTNRHDGRNIFFPFLYFPVVVVLRQGLSLTSISLVTEG